MSKGFNRQEIFDRHWLDFETVYRSAGWDVHFSKPAYNESGDAVFTFKPRRRVTRKAKGMRETKL